MAEGSDGGGGTPAAGAGPPYPVYPRRWLMLALFALTSCANAAHWLQFSIIANVVEEFYGVGSLAVNWTSMVYMAAYVPLVFPASWLMERKGLRVSLLAGAGLMSVGAWVKAAAAEPDRFPLAFAGQALVGAAQMFTLGAPARLAALWFGPGQVSTACAIGVFGNQVGIALGFLLPPALVPAHQSPERTARDLYRLYLGMAAAPTLLLLMLILMFEEAPASPPSAAQARLQQPQPQPAGKGKGGSLAMSECPGGLPPAPASFLGSLRQLAANRSFVLLWLSYGLNVGVFYAVSTLLNQMVLLHFQGAEEDAGRIGLTIVLAGILGSVSGGLVLDRTRRYKETTLVVYLMALAGMLAFTFALTSADLRLVYASGAFLGFFMTGYLGVGYEYAAELTYPVPEGTSSGLLNAASEIFGVALTLSTGEVLERLGDRVTNLGLSAGLAVGLLLSLFLQGGQMRRSQAAVQPAPCEPVAVKVVG